MNDQKHIKGQRYNRLSIIHTLPSPNLPIAPIQDYLATDLHCIGIVYFYYKSICIQIPFFLCMFYAKIGANIFLLK